MPRLTVGSQVDTQILLIGSDLQVVQRGIGQLRADVPAGLYKIKVERGGGTVEQLIELTKDEYVHLFVDKFPAIAPIQPLLGNDWFSIETVCKQAMPGFPPAPPGQPLPPGSPEPGLLVLSHRSLDDGAGLDPFAGLRLMSLQMNLPTELAAQPLHQVSASGQIWRAAWLPLEPGCHLLEITDAGQTVVQSVLIAPSWQTRVFVRRQRWQGRSSDLPNGESRRDWIDVSIQMAPPNAQVVYSDHLETVEVARNALELSRPIFVSNVLISDLLHSKFDNPITGITGMHLFLEALERSNAPRGNDASRELQIDPAFAANSTAIVAETIGNLQRLLCGEGPTQRPDPSDLIALKARAGLLPLGPNKVPVTEPPMLWASWDALRRHAGPGESIEVSSDLWKRVAWGNAWGPYLAWPPRTATFNDFVDSQLRAHRERTGPNAAVQLLEGTELAKALNIPLSVIE